MGNDDVSIKHDSDSYLSNGAQIINTETVRLPTTTFIEMASQNQNLKARERFTKKILLLIIIILGVAVLLLIRAHLDRDKVEEKRIRENEENIFNFSKREVKNETEIKGNRSQEVNAKNETGKLEEDFGEKIKSAIRKLEKLKSLDEVPDELMYDWIPVPSKFKGVQEYVYKEKLNGTYFEKVLYQSKPMFYRYKDQTKKMRLQLVMGKIILKTIMLFDNEDSSNSDKTKVSLHDGDLHIDQVWTSSDYVEFKVTRVYSIMDDDLENAYN